MTSVRNEVRIFTKQAENIICNPKSPGEIEEILIDVTNLLGHGEVKTCTFSNLQTAKDIFKDSFYSQLGYFLLDQLTVGWIAKNLQNSNVKQLFDSVYFLRNGSQRQAFVVLVNAVNKSRPGVKQSRCINLLERFIGGDCFCDVVWQQCHEVKQPEHDFMVEELLTAISSLPDKTANALQFQNSDEFLPQNFVPLVGKTLLICLSRSKEVLANGRNIDITFISRLMSRLCMIGFSELLWETLLPELTVRVREDFIWCRVCERLTTGIPERCMETVLGTLIKLLPWYGLVEKFLGDSIIKSNRVQFILCTKMLLLQHSEKTLVLHNILGYVASSHSRHPVFIKTMLELLKVWGDSSALRHTSPEQHLYITKALLVCCAYINEHDKQQHKDEIIRTLMPGVQNHISSSEPKVCRQGMVVAQTITSVVDPKGPQLKFEINKNEEDVAALMSLTKTPEEPKVQNVTSDLTKLQICGEKSLKSKQNNKKIENKMNEEDLDSDDDLEPYDLSNDVKVTKVRQPKYIRECMEGLISTADADVDKVEICLSTSESLIRRNPDGLEEVAEEFTKILLHLSNKLSSQEFTQQRFSALVALAVGVPVKVSKYLTQEFYARNYNLRQRMDILEVISSAVQELSKPLTSPAPTPKVTTVSSTAASQDDWHEIVKQRIESKTRRFVKGPSKPTAVPSVNKIAGIAGHFFFPLLHGFDRKEATFDLLGSDSLVLGRLVYTLGMIMYAAINTLEAKKLGSALLQFTWSIRFHIDIVVRHAVLYAVSMVILSVPGHILMSELQPEILEAKQWLEDTVEKDTDSESRKLALQALVLLENVIKQEFSKGSGT